jgi:hypothetical protein
MSKPPSDFGVWKALVVILLITTAIVVGGGWLGRWFP